LLLELLSHTPIDVQRCGLLTAAGKRDHQPRMGPLIERVRSGQLVQVRQYPVVPSEAASDLGEIRHHGCPPLHQRVNRRVPLQQANVAERLTPPKLQAGGVGIECGKVAAHRCGALGTLAVLPEGEQVEMIIGNPQRVITAV
jgi:hypothetical protein